MKRDARLDTIRGLALVIMTLVHLPYPYAQWFKGLLGFATFAHVFVFLSGFVAGLVYQHRAPVMSTLDVWRKALGRTGTIWVMHVAVSIFLVALVLALDAAGTEFTRMPTAFILARPGLAVFLSALLIYLPGYTHILAMYVIFVALLAPAMVVLRRGRPLLVLVATIALWGVAQFGVRDAILEVLGGHMATLAGYYDVLAWQLLFVVGIVAGAARARGVLERFRLPMVAVPLLLAVHGALMAIRHEWWAGPGLPEIVTAWASDERLGPVRILDCVLVGLLAAEAMRRWPAAFRNGWLALLGRHSMTVFVVHVVLVCGISPLPVRDALQAPVGIAILLLLTAAAWIAEARRRRARDAREAPAAS